MSAGKLDRSLDEIMKDNPTKGAGGRRGRGRLPGRKAATKSKAATAAVIAPTGGVQKQNRSAKQATRTPTGPAFTGDSRISVTNLPLDVTEALIKDYFGSAVAPVKRVVVNYDANGRSRGSATVVFGKPTAATDAVKLDGTKVDGRAMRIEVLLSAKAVPPPQPPKPLSERMSQPKNAAKDKPKSVAKAKAPTDKAAAGSEKKGKGKGKAGRAGRPKAKTAEELDAEMQDYFGSGEPNGATGNATAQSSAAPAGGDAMVDEVM